jgi:hypothetical protein
MNLRFVIEEARFGWTNQPTQHIIDRISRIRTGIFKIDRDMHPMTLVSYIAQGGDNAPL